MVDQKHLRFVLGALGALVALGCSSPADLGSGYTGTLCGFVEANQSPYTWAGPDECLLVRAVEPSSATLTPLDASACDVGSRGTPCAVVREQGGWRLWAAFQDVAGGRVRGETLTSALDAEGACPLSCDEQPKPAMLAFQDTGRETCTSLSTSAPCDAGPPIHDSASFSGAGHEARTRDPELGKLVLYQLS
jgi:hypothetical protein